jgi:hypothetical protein
MAEVTAQRNTAIDVRWTERTHSDFLVTVTEAESPLVWIVERLPITQLYVLKASSTRLQQSPGSGAIFMPTSKSQRPGKGNSKMPSRPDMNRLFSQYDNDH